MIPRGSLQRVVAYLAFFVSGLLFAAPEDQFTSFAGFRLGDISLPEIQRSLGLVEALHTGDAGESLTTICYHVGNYAVLFMAGELGGQSKNLGGFMILKRPERLPCAKWPTEIQRPRPKIGGVELGMSREQVRAVLEDGIEQADGTYTRVFESKHAMSSEDLHRLPPDAQVQHRQGKLRLQWDIVVHVMTRFVDGHAAEIEVWKTKTW